MNLGVIEIKRIWLYQKTFSFMSNDKYKLFTRGLIPQNTDYLFHIMHFDKMLKETFFVRNRSKA